MKKFLFLMLIPTMVAAQQTINGLNIKGKLDVISTTKSSNPCPSMTEAQRDLITVPSIGSCVYNTSALSLNVYNGAEWKSAGGGGISLWLTLTNYKTDDVVIDSNKIYKSLSDHTSGVFATDLANGNWVEISASEIVDLTTDVTGILPIANGGTGASAKNFVDLTTNQSVAGDKTFTGETTFSNRVTMTGMVNIDRPEGIVKTDNTGNIEVGKIDLTDEVVGSLPQNNGGNGNLIPTNASFELSPVNTDWTCSAIVPSASGPAAVDGAQGITFTASSTNQGCTRYVSMPEGNIGQLLEYSMYVFSTGGDVEVCSINDSIVSNCKTYTVGQSSNLTKIIVTDRPKNTNSNANGILFRTKTATSTTFLGDLVYVGLPKSDEAIVAKFEAGTQGELLTLGTSLINQTHDLSSVTSTNSVGSGLYTKSSNGLTFVRDSNVTVSFTAITGNATIAGTSIYLNGVQVSTDGFATTAANVAATSVMSMPVKSGDKITFTSSSFVAISNQKISILATTTSNAAIVACKEGPLKCNNLYSATISSANVITNQSPANFLNTFSWTSAGEGSGTFTAGNFTVAPKCWTEVGVTWSASVYSANAHSETSTGVSVSARTQAVGAASPPSVKLFCLKQGSDYNAGYEKVLGFTEDADIRSTEWLTGGFDYISGKPIYKRCHRVASDITTSGATLVTWASNLNPIDKVNNFSANWILLTSNNAQVYYNRSTGQVVANAASGDKVGAGTTFCMEYVK